MSSPAAGQDVIDLVDSDAGGDSQGLLDSDTEVGSCPVWVSGWVGGFTTWV